MPNRIQERNRRRRGKGIGLILAYIAFESGSNNDNSRISVGCLTRPPSSPMRVFESTSVVDVNQAVGFDNTRDTIVTSFRNSPLQEASWVYAESRGVFNRPTVGLRGDSIKPITLQAASRERIFAFIKLSISCIDGGCFI